jgi:hypothetical protein
MSWLRVAMRRSFRVADNGPNAVLLSASPVPVPVPAPGPFPVTASPPGAGGRWRVYPTTGPSSPARQSSAGGKIAALTGITSHEGNHKRTPSQKASSDGCARSAGRKTLFLHACPRAANTDRVEDDYNNVRPHSSLGNLPPTVYAKRSVPVMQRDGSLRKVPVASPSLDGSKTLGTLPIAG